MAAPSQSSRGSDWPRKSRQDVVLAASLTNWQAPSHSSPHTQTPVMVSNSIFLSSLDGADQRLTRWWPERSCDSTIGYSAQCIVICLSHSVTRPFLRFKLSEGEHRKMPGLPVWFLSANLQTIKVEMPRALSPTVTTDPCLPTSVSKLQSLCWWGNVCQVEWWSWELPHLLTALWYWHSPGRAPGTRQLRGERQKHESRH